MERRRSDISTGRGAPRLPEGTADPAAWNAGPEEARTLAEGRVALRLGGVPPAPMPRAPPCVSRPPLRPDGAAAVTGHVDEVRPAPDAADDDVEGGGVPDGERGGARADARAFVTLEGDARQSPVSAATSADAEREPAAHVLRRPSPPFTSPIRGAGVARPRPTALGASPARSAGREATRGDAGARDKTVLHWDGDKRATPFWAPQCVSCGQSKSVPSAALSGSSSPPHGKGPPASS